MNNLRRHTVRRRNRRRTARNPLIITRMRVPRPRVVFDGQRLRSSGLPSGSVVTTAAQNGTCLVSFDCANATNSASASQNVMVSLYNEYLYESATLEWIPNVGPSSTDASARMAVAFIYNPEVMTYAITNLATPSLIIPLVDSGAGVKYFSAWERFRINVPFINRRKLFDVNSNEAQTDVNVDDRSVQAMAVCYGISSTAVVTLGRWHVSYVLRLQGINGLSAVTT